MTLRDRIKALAYSCGALGLCHRFRNRSHLTVVMFHRVLPRGSAEWAHADTEYTMEADIFENCLDFFKRHYNVVDLHSVIAAGNGGAALPPYPLLITLDDGWSDTLRFAAPILKAVCLPAVCFTVSDVLDEQEPRWWQNTFTLAWRERDAALEAVNKAWRESGFRALSPADGDNVYHHTLGMMTELPEATRADLIHKWEGDGGGDGVRHMLRAEDLPRLVDFSVAIGGHGASHVPLTMCSDPRSEFMRSRERLNKIIGSTPQQSVVAMSFPHGRFTEHLLIEARRSGYRMMFTSVEKLVPTVDGELTTDVCGRISIRTDTVIDGDGGFRPDLLALRLFFPPASALAPRAAG